MFVVLSTHLPHSTYHPVPGVCYVCVVGYSLQLGMICQHIYLMWFYSTQGMATMYPVHYFIFHRLMVVAHEHLPTGSLLPCVMCILH